METSSSNVSATSMDGVGIMDISFYEAHAKARSGKNVTHKCSLCSYETIHKSTMKTHMKTHSAERPFKCEFCSKCFKLKHHLKHHIVTHKVPNAFKCNSCPYRGTSNLSLLMHKQKKHGESIPQVNMNRVLNNVVREGRASASYSSTFPPWTSVSSTSRPQAEDPSPSLQDVNFPEACDAGSQSIRSSSLSDSDGMPTIMRVLSTEAGTHFGFRLDMPKFEGRDVTVKPEGTEFVNLVDEESETSERGSEGPFPAVSTGETMATGNSVLNSPSFDGPTQSAASSETVGSSPTRPGSHSETSHPDIVPSDTVSTAGPRACTWKCEPCGITFPDNIMYGLHTACHSVQQPYKCNICGKVCRDKYDFTFHITMGRHEL